MSIDAGAQVVIILLACRPCVVIVNCLGQVLYLGRAPRTKETLPDFHEWSWITRRSRIFRGLTGCQRDPRDRGVTKSHVMEFSIATGIFFYIFQHCRNIEMLCRDNKILLSAYSLSRQKMLCHDRKTQSLASLCCDGKNPVATQILSPRPNSVVT